MARLYRATARKGQWNRALEYGKAVPRPRPMICCFISLCLLTCLWLASRSATAEIILRRFHGDRVANIGGIAESSGGRRLLSTSETSDPNAKFYNYKCEQKNSSTRAVVAWETCDTEKATGNIGGWITLYIVCTIIIFIAVAIVCDDFFVPSLEIISEKLKLSEDVAGATFMAAGSSAPELFSSVAAVAFDSDAGVGTIAGSAVFNLLVIISLTAAFAGKVLHLDWRPLARDSIYYLISIIYFIVMMQDTVVQIWDAVVLLVLYIVYIVIMVLNPRLMNKLAELEKKCSCHCRVEPTDDAEQQAGESEEPTADQSRRASVASAASGHSQEKRQFRHNRRNSVLLNLHSSPSGLRTERRESVTQSMAVAAAIAAAAGATAASSPSIRRDSGVGVGSGSGRPSSAESADADDTSVDNRPERQRRQRRKRNLQVTPGDEAGDAEAAGPNGVQRPALVSRHSLPPLRAQSLMTAFQQQEQQQLSALPPIHQQEQQKLQRRLSKRPNEATLKEEDSTAAGSYGEEWSVANGNNRKKRPDSQNEDDGEGDGEGEGGGEEEGEEEDDDDARIPCCSCCSCCPDIRGAPPKKSETMTAGKWAIYVLKWIIFVLAFPFLCLFSWTVPECSKEHLKKYFIVSFLMSVLWIAALSFGMVTVVARLGCLFGVDTFVMSLVVLAAGTSVPDLLSSIIVARDGFGDMAVSNAIGSNVFDINMGLGLPFFIRLCINKIEPLDMFSDEERRSYCEGHMDMIPHVKFGIILIILLVIAFSVISISKYRLGKVIGISFFCMYIGFLVYAFCQEFLCEYNC